MFFRTFSHSYTNPQFLSPTDYAGSGLHLPNLNGQWPATSCQELSSWYFGAVQALPLLHHYEKPGSDFVGIYHSQDSNLWLCTVLMLFIQS